MVITVYSDRRIHDVTGVAEMLAEVIGEQVRPRQVTLYIDRVASEARSRRKRAPVRRALPLNPVPALASAADAPDVTVLGVWGPVTEQVITAFDLSRVVVLLTDDAVMSLRAAQRTLKLCAGLGFGADRIVVVKLVDDGDESIEPAAVASALKREIFGTLPSSANDATEDRQAYHRLTSKLLGASGER